MKLRSIDEDIDGAGLRFDEAHMGDWLSIVDVESIRCHSYTMAYYVDGDGLPIVEFKSVREYDLIEFTCTYTLHRFSVELVKKLLIFQEPELKGIGKMTLAEAAHQLIESAGCEPGPMSTLIEERQKKLDAALEKKRKRKQEGEDPDLPCEEGTDDPVGDSVVCSIIEQGGIVEDEFNDDVEVPQFLQQLCPQEVAFLQGLVPGSAGLQEEETDEGMEAKQKEEERREAEVKKTRKSSIRTEPRSAAPRRPPSPAPATPRRSPSPVGSPEPSRHRSCSKEPGDSLFAPSSPLSLPSPISEPGAMPPPAPSWPPSVIPLFDIDDDRWLNGVLQTDGEGGATPPGGDVAPPGGEVAPPDEEIDWAGGAVTPPVGEVTPGGEGAPPGGEVTPPGGEDPPPGGELTPPGGEVPAPIAIPRPFVAGLLGHICKFHEKDLWHE